MLLGSCDGREKELNHGAEQWRLLGAQQRAIGTRFTLVVFSLFFPFLSIFYYETLQNFQSPSPRTCREPILLAISILLPLYKDTTKKKSLSTDERARTLSWRVTRQPPLMTRPFPPPPESPHARNKTTDQLRTFGMNILLFFFFGSIVAHTYPSLSLTKDTHTHTHTRLFFCCTEHWN